MPARFETTIQTKAPLARVLEYYAHPENLPKIHPGFVKDVKILSREGDVITLEQHAEIMGRKIRSVNKMTLDRSANTFNIDTMDGDGKGSKITMAVKEVPTGTEVHYSAALELGALGFFAKGPAKSTFERTAQEDKQQLDTVS
jgi:carbon monoxide dehydrogenase subunit G